MFEVIARLFRRLFGASEEPAPRVEPVDLPVRRVRIDPAIEEPGEAPVEERPTEPADSPPEPGTEENELEEEGQEQEEGEEPSESFPFGLRSTEVNPDAGELYRIPYMAKTGQTIMVYVDAVLNNRNPARFRPFEIRQVNGERIPDEISITPMPGYSAYDRRLGGKLDASGEWFGIVSLTDESLVADENASEAGVYSTHLEAYVEGVALRSPDADQSFTWKDEFTLRELVEVARFKELARRDYDRFGRPTPRQFE